MAQTLHSLEQRFLSQQTQYTMKLGQKAQLDRQYQQAVKSREEAITQLELYQKTQDLLLKASATARTVVQERIENLVTLALSAIKGEPYQFKMSLIQQSGQYVVDFKIINPEGLELDPLNNCGGGIADITSMALRIAILEMYEPRVDGPIQLDENFKFLSREHIRTAVEWIRMLVEKTERQIILVTHVPELAAGADKVFEVIAKDGTSSISDVTNEHKSTLEA